MKTHCILHRNLLSWSTYHHDMYQAWPANRRFEEIAEYVQIQYLYSGKSSSPVFFFLILTNCHHTEQKLKLRVPIVKISLSVSYKYLEMSFFLIVVVVFWPFYNFLLNATSTTICLPVFRQSSFYLISVLQHCIFPSDTVNVFYYLTILCPFTCKLPFISKILILKITNKPMVYAW